MRRMKNILYCLLFIYSAASAQSWPVSEPKVQSVSFKSGTFSMLDYQANADAMTLTTTAINSAIQSCHEHGGGTVLVPKGFWLTGPIVLKSNVNLHLVQGAVPQFSDQPDDY